MKGEKPSSLINRYLCKHLSEAKDPAVLTVGEGHPHREDGEDKCPEAEGASLVCSGWREQGEPGEEKRLGPTARSQRDSWAIVTMVRASRGWAGT